MKKNLFIVQKAKVVRESYQLKIITEEETRKFPISLIKNLYLFGKSEINRSTKNFLLSKNIDIYFLSYSGKLQGVLTNTILKSDYKNRLNQYNAHQKNDIEIPKWIVKNKIETIENYYGRSLQKYKNKLQESDNIASILGIEGTTSKFLFEKIKTELKEVEIDFEGRNYRPPKDITNALLSFVYVLYYNHLYSLILSYGLDPYIGFLHTKRGTHAPLASDLLEFKRVALSKFVVEILKNKKIAKEDMNEDFTLKKEAIKILISSFVKEFLENETDQKENDENIKKLIGFF